MSMPSASLLNLSPLPHLWLVDIDGTILAHNGHLGGQEKVLPGVQDFWRQIPTGDVIVLLTARQQAHCETTLACLQAHGLRFDRVLFEMPMGERILINDAKPSCLQTALAVNLERDAGMRNLKIKIDPNL